MEKVILAFNTLKSEGLAKRLLANMLEKKVPGFCTEVLSALRLFELDLSSIEMVRDGKVLRELIKRKIVKIQNAQLVEHLLTESKTD